MTGPGAADRDANFEHPGAAQINTADSAIRAAAGVREILARMRPTSSS
jgi:hypothetical protein